MKIKRNKGFTLVELFISTTIIFFVSVTVYSTFLNAINVWRRANVSRKLEKDIAITLTKLSRDMRNVFDFSGIPFEGTEYAVFFPGFVKAASSEQSSQGEVGRIAYFFDKDKMTLFKEEKNYPRVYKEDKIEDDYVVPLISGIEQLTFSYCYLDGLSGEYKWKDSWKKEDQDSVPQAVKLELVLKKNEINAGQFTKTIFIPIGTGEQKKEFGNTVKTAQE